jgi:osmotically-inducible protein OsmY
MTALAYRADLDSDLAKRVRIFLTESRNAFRAISVRAQNGVICLSGTVPSFYLRQLATSCARRVAGVRTVIDAIEVVDDGDGAREPRRKPHGIGSAVALTH